MSVESATEQGLKTALQVHTDTLDPDTKPDYRCFFLDDETLTGEEKEEKEYPLVQITASPNVPTHHKATFRHVSVEIKFATKRIDDPKKQTLVALYENCRDIIDTESTISIEGFNLIGAIVESGGETDVDESEQYITLPLTMKLCGA